MSTNRDSTRVLAIDDHPMLREGFATVVATQPDWSLVALASNGWSGSAVLGAPPRSHADGLQMPAMNCLEEIVAIRNEFPMRRLSSWRPTKANSRTLRDLGP